MQRAAKYIFSERLKTWSHYVSRNVAFVKKSRENIREDENLDRLCWYH